MQGVRFVKGHGTENDFVVLPDPEGRLELSDARVRALCDRRRGLGADGVLRVVPTSLVLDAPDGLEPGSWFMDYRNADGSRAEMCGNGVRVFARYLVDAGIADPGDILIGTRAGPRPVTVHTDGRVSVDMGPARVGEASDAVLDGHRYQGVAVDVGNPHLACMTSEPLDELTLGPAPQYDAVAFPHGVNVEFVHAVSAARVRMRVYERGVGETRSCGTGTVAAARAALHAEGRTTGTREVLVPGGAVEVAITSETSVLTGPAELVARGELDLQWWDAL